MHSLMHREYGAAAAPHRRPHRGHRPSPPPKGPPGRPRLRRRAARGLAALALRLDREQARRAIA